MGFLDNSGLSYFWGKIKSYVANSSPVLSISGMTGTPHGLIYKGASTTLGITDLDTVFQPGIYYLNSDGIANAPSGYKWGFLHVTATNDGSSGLVTQELHKDGNAATNNNFRRRWSGDPLYWSDWMADVMSVNGMTGAVVIESQVDSGSGSGVAVATGTYTTVKSLTLTPGVYIIDFGATFASNATGYRSVGISTGSNMNNAAYPAGQRTRAVDGLTTWVSCSCTYNITSNTTYNLIVHQNSGSSLNVGWGYRLTKLP